MMSDPIEENWEGINIKGGSPTINNPTFINQQIVQKAPPAVPTGIPHNLPYSGAEQFVGREDKLELLHGELTDGQQVVITAIAGMGGIGKTELALQYALRYQDRYPGGLCWLQVRGKELGIQIIDFARERININPPDDFDLQGQVKYCWSHWKEGTALIVLDDVPKYGNYYRKNILPYLPPAQSRFKVLMTSRQRPDRGIRGIDLDVLSPGAALELLKVLVGAERIEGEIEAAQALCEWLGYLPLGLELVGRYLDNHQTLTLAKVLDRLESKRLAARALLQQEYGNMTAPLGVAAAFELSWVELNDEAQQLSCLLSLFASVPFDWQLVEQCLPDSDEEDLEDIRDDYLLKFNLLQLTSQNTYRIHPLVREFLQAKLAQLESGLQLKQSFAGVMAAIGNK
ncbi:MAG: NB-ARC domain-containing protein [Cyanobacteria bacterium J06639_18]